MELFKISQCKLDKKLFDAVIKKNDKLVFKYLNIGADPTKKFVVDSLPDLYSAIDIVINHANCTYFIQMVNFSKNFILNSKTDYLSVLKNSVFYNNNFKKNSYFTDLSDAALMLLLITDHIDCSDSLVRYADFVDSNGFIINEMACAMIFQNLSLYNEDAFEKILSSNNDEVFDSLVSKNIDFSLLDFSSKNVCEKNIFETKFCDTYFKNSLEVAFRFANDYQKKIILLSYLEKGLYEDVFSLNSDFVFETIVSSKLDIDYSSVKMKNGDNFFSFATGSNNYDFILLVLKNYLQKKLFSDIASSIVLAISNNNTELFNLLIASNIDLSNYNIENKNIVRYLFDNADVSNDYLNYANSIILKNTGHSVKYFLKNTDIDILFSNLMLESIYKIICSCNVVDHDNFLKITLPNYEFEYVLDQKLLNTFNLDGTNFLKLSVIYENEVMCKYFLKYSNFLKNDSYFFDLFCLANESGNTKIINLLNMHCDFNFMSNVSNKKIKKI